MPNISVTNLLSTALSLPSGYRTDLIQPGATVTVTVPDTNEFLGDPRVDGLITGGSIYVTLSSGDALDRPLPEYATSSLPSATRTASGSVVWNTDVRNLYHNDGSAWAPLVEGGSIIQTVAGADVAANRFVGLNTAGAVAVSPVATERVLGVSTEALTAAGTGRVQIGGVVEVMPSSAIAAANELIAVPGGFAAPFQAAAVSLGTAVAGADASDDVDQSNLPDAVTVTCGGNETGNTVIVYGDVGGSYTKEVITLGAAGSYTSTNTFAAIYCLETTAVATGTIDIRDASLTGLLIPQIAGTTAARKYGAIVPDVSTDPEGHKVQIQAGGANASDVVLFGTDFSGTEQAEVVTLNGANWVDGTLAFRSLSHVFIGADGIAWNAGATSQYDQQVAADVKREIRAFALEAEAVAGATVRAMLLPQNQGLVQGETPMPFAHVKYSGTPGGATLALTVPGVAAGDLIHATLNTRTNAETLIMASRTAADTITVTFSGDPGASTVSVSVFRP